MSKFILNIHCPDQKGIIATVTNFIHLNAGNILYIDQYVETRKNGQADTVIFNEELWTFLSQRYGGDTVKRYWGHSSQGIYTRVAVRLD